AQTRRRAKRGGCHCRAVAPPHRRSRRKTRRCGDQRRQRRRRAFRRHRGLTFARHMFARRHWIPPAGMIFGQLCHGASWLVALAIATFLSADPTTLPAIAWIHLVALGWVTVTAFSILLHAIPAFLDVPWKHETFARASLGIGAAAIAAFVI